MTGKKKSQSSKNNRTFKVDNYLIAKYLFRTDKSWQSVVISELFIRNHFSISYTQGTCPRGIEL